MKQRERFFYVFVRSNAETDPPAVRQYVMSLYSPLLEQLLLHTHGERNIQKTLAVKMTEFSPTTAELSAAKPVRVDSHVVPR